MSDDEQDDEIDITALSDDIAQEKSPLREFAFESWDDDWEDRGDEEPSREKIQEAPKENTRPGKVLKHVKNVMSPREKCGLELPIEDSEEEEEELPLRERRQQLLRMNGKVQQKNNVLGGYINSIEQKEKINEKQLTRQQQKCMIQSQQQGSTTKGNVHTGQRVTPKLTVGPSAKQRANMPREVGNGLEQRGSDVGLSTEQRGEKVGMTSWCGQRGSKCGDLVGHGLKQKIEGSETGARQREKLLGDMGKCTGQQSTAALGIDSSVHEAADKKGGARQQVKVPCEEVNRQQQQACEGPRQLVKATTTKANDMGTGQQSKQPALGTGQQPKQPTMGTGEGGNEHMYREEKSGRGSLRDLIASARADIQAGSRVCAKENIQEAAEKSGIVGHMPRAEGEKDGKKRMPRIEQKKNEKRQAGQASTKVLTGEQLAENEMLQQRFDDCESPRQPEVRDLLEENERWTKVADDYLNKFLDEKKKADSEMVNAIALELRVQRLSERLKGMHEIHEDLADEHEAKLSELKKLREEHDTLLECYKDLEETCAKGSQAASRAQPKRGGKK
ncbi:hypothetical protein FRX31_026037 [Thalictrum thalictroides]|uniref:Uncharacterized protein n=1 Tax=Thalictrum thalictroides TaxID=46969 RepID=A0A7J6VGZ0_THATH|nr:hypothetical protein FRX31_026037 [Thalictrum thalictroides]